MNKVDILEEVSENFLVYATDTNNNKSFPDVRDGLKPGQRACLWAMYKAGFSSSKPHVKSAKIDGLVAANYWPHGTSAIYETFTRMSQPFTNNNPEVEFHGANGNVIVGGDSMAADRYTEARLAPITEQGMLEGVENNAVDMILNFSEDEKWPKVLPAVFPRLLVNGAQGIGVGIATEWTLHNLQETVDMLTKFLKTGEVDNDNYFPDFPSGGNIINKDELYKINSCGKGKIVVESVYEICGREIKFTEFPYQVYIEPVVEEIKKAVDTGKVTGIAEVNNKSDKKQILLSIKCAASAFPNEVAEALLSCTSLRKQYNVNQMAISSKTPRLFTLQDYCEEYKKHNLECIQRKYHFELDKLEERIEILEGLKTIRNNIDEAISIIKKNDSPKEELQKIYSLTNRQVKAVLDMRLTSMSKMETRKLDKELEAKQKRKLEVEEIISSEKKQIDILIQELQNLADKFSSSRKTRLIQKDFSRKDGQKKKKTIEEIVIAYTQDGYIKSIPKSKFKTSSEHVREIPCTTDDMVQIYNSTKMYRIKAENIKQCLSSEKGTAVGALLKTGMIKVHGVYLCGEDRSLVAITESGRIKKFNTSLFNGTTQCLRGMDYFPNNSVMLLQESEGRKYAIAKTKTHELTADISTVKESGKASTGRQLMKCDKNERLESVFCVISTDKPLSSLGARGKKI